MAKKIPETEKPEIVFLDLIYRYKALRVESFVNKNSELTKAQQDFLEYIKNMPGAHPGEAALHLNVSEPTISQRYNILSNLDLLAMRKAVGDRRKRQIYLTVKASKVLMKQEQIKIKNVQHFLSGLTMNEQKQLLDSLDKVISTLELAKARLADTPK